MTIKNARKYVILVVLFPLIALLLAVVLPCLATYRVFVFYRRLRLRAKFRRKWGPDGKSVIFVYSESPNWQSYIEQEILPKLSPYAISLNYSRRAEWKNNKPLEALIWEHWAGEREFNPMAIVLPNRGKVRTIRFYQAFRDLKHGKDRLLRQKEDELFEYVSQINTHH